MSSFFLRAPVWCFCLALICGVGPRASAQTSEDPDAPSRSTLERQTFALINKYREANDLAAFTWSDEIAKTARLHSRDMARGDVDFGHDGFGDRMAHLRRALPGLTGCGENVLMTSDPRDVAQSAVTLWLRSAPHRKNIRGDYNFSGIGVWENEQGVIYFTEIFVRLQPVIPTVYPATPLYLPPASVPTQTEP
jgi:uncharacterized protein YkwD